MNKQLKRRRGPKKPKVVLHRLTSAEIEAWTKGEKNDVFKAALDSVNKVLTVDVPRLPTDLTTTEESPTNSEIVRGSEAVGNVNVESTLTSSSASSDEDEEVSMNVNVFSNGLTTKSKRSRSVSPCSSVSSAMGPPPPPPLASSSEKNNNSNSRPGSGSGRSSSSRRKLSTPTKRKVIKADDGVSNGHENDLKKPVNNVEVVVLDDDEEEEDNLTKSSPKKKPKRESKELKKLLTSPILGGDILNEPRSTRHRPGPASRKRHR